MSQDSFYDLKGLAAQIGTNFSKNSEYESFKLGDVKIIRVESQHPRTFFYKTSYSETDFRKVEVDKKSDRRSKKNEAGPGPEVTLNKAYKRKIPISEKKKSALLNLLKKI